jgi:hypothetical protein
LETSCAGVMAYATDGLSTAAILKSTFLSVAR